MNYFFCPLLQIILHVVLKFSTNQKFIMLNHTIRRKKFFMVLGKSHGSK